jgi:hypothetical protein
MKTITEMERAVERDGKGAIEVCDLIDLFAAYRTMREVLVHYAESHANKCSRAEQVLATLRPKP